MKQDTISTSNSASKSVTGRTGPKCLACGQRDITILDDPNSKGYCYSCRMKALGVPVFKDDPDDAAWDRPIRYNACIVKAFDFTPYFNVLALLCLTAVILGLVFTDQPTGFHGDTSAVGSGAVAQSSGAAVPLSEEIR